MKDSSLGFAVILLGITVIISFLGINTVEVNLNQKIGQLEQRIEELENVTKAQRSSLE
jgi:CHASE3 domain sensor protein